MPESQPHPDEHRLRVDGIPIVIQRHARSKRSGTTIILAHGAGQDMDSSFMSFFHEGLWAFGYTSVKFNFPYMEAGRRAPDSREKLNSTWNSVIGTVLTECSPRKLIIGGKSMGGRIASYVADSVPEVDGLVFLGYPLHPPGKPDRLRDTHLYTLPQSMLFLSGTRDSLATARLLASVVERIGPRAQIHWIEGGDHSLSRGRRAADTRPEALKVMDEWIRRITK